MTEDSSAPCHASTARLRRPVLLLPCEARELMVSFSGETRTTMTMSTNTARSRRRSFFAPGRAYPAAPARAFDDPSHDQPGQQAGNGIAPSVGVGERGAGTAMTLKALELGQGRMQHRAERGVGVLDGLRYHVCER